MNAPSLLRVAFKAVTCRDRDALAEFFCEEVVRELDARWAALAYRDPEGDFVASVGFPVVEPGSPVGAATVVMAVDPPDRYDAGALAIDLPGTLRQEEAEYLRQLVELLAEAFQRIEEDEELKLSERRLAEAQEMAKLGSYDWNIVTDTNVWSDELYRIYGYEPGTFNASYERFLSMIHPDDRDRIVAIHTRAMQDYQPYRMEERIIRPDGEIRILDSSGKVVLDNAGRPMRMVGICLDVTELRRAAERGAKAEQELAREAERRAQALEINDNVVQGLTAVAGALELGNQGTALLGTRATLAAASRMMSKLLGFLEGELQPGDLIRGGHAPPHLTDLLADDGTFGLADSASETVTVLLADDSDDLRQLYRLLLESRGFRVVAEAADGIEAVSLARRVQPDVALIDLAMPGLDGLQVTAELRAHLPQCRIVILSGFEQSRVGEQARQAGADRFVQKGGEADELASIIMDMFPGVMLSEMPKLEIPSDPDAAIDDELLHELRTPITVVFGLVSTIVSQFDQLPSTTLRELLETASRNASHLAALLERYSAMRRIQAGHVPLVAERFDLEEMVRSTAEDARALLGETSLQIEANPLLVNADPLRVRQILLNLFSNVAKYGARGEPVRVGVQACGNMAEVSVTNAGTGIRPEDRERIFRRLGSKHAGTGVGLGLWISRTLAQAQGGNLELVKGDPSATTFVLRLPASAERLAPSS